MASHGVRGLLSVLFLLMWGSVASADRLTVIAGGGLGGEGSKATEAQLHSPFGVEYDRAGNLFIVELEGGHIHKVDTQGIFTTIAGNGERGFAGDGSSAAGAVFNAIHNLAISPIGDLYIADTLNHRVRKIDAKTGIITTFAGNGEKGFAGDRGPALKGSFDGVYCIAFHPQFTTLYVADLENRRVRAIDMTTGRIDTVAGNGTKGIPADGSLARDAPLVDPRAVAADAAGNLYILERGGHALRAVDPAGRIRTVVGTGKPGGTGDGGAALEATLRGPKHLCIDRDGSVVIADTDNHLIRRYVPKTGRIERIAGTGQKGSAIGGSPEKVDLNFPHGVYVHTDGRLLIADTYNNRVLRLVKE
jgi:DNA-binding beta-propeller fold protein YncE